MDVVLPLSLSAAQLSSTLAPVPYLSPVVGAVVAIIQLCQNVTINKRSIDQLQDRCRVLLESIHRHTFAASSETLIEAAIVAENTLKGIRKKVEYWSNLRRIQAFAMQREISEELQRCHIGVSDCMSRLQLTSHTELHRWQEQFKSNQERDHDEVIRYLSEIQNSNIITQEIVTESAADIKALMRLMQNSLPMTNRSENMRHGLQQNLYQVSQSSGELLPDFNLQRGEVSRIGQYPVSGTAAMDIWEGLYLQREKVAIKVIRAVNSDQKSIRRFLREVGIWGEIWKIDRGKHVLPFFGFCLNDGPYPYMVSPWQKNGNAINYVKIHDDSVNYWHLIRGIAEGLRVLHTMSPPVIHGDLRGINIAINDVGEPLIADFGLAQIVEDVTGVPFTQSRGVSDSYRWFAPEVCMGQGSLSTSSDIYSFAMTALELITHKSPYSHIKHTTEVVIRSHMGEHPHRPTESQVIDRGFNDRLWNLLLKCWEVDPLKRPNINDVLSFF